MALQNGTLRSVDNPILLLSDLPALREQWRSALLRRGRSLSTVRIYMWAVKKLIDHAGTEPVPLTRSRLERWQDDLIESKNFILEAVPWRGLAFTAC